MAPPNSGSWNVAVIRESLLSWYTANRRKLPWRGDAPPWAADKAGMRKAAAREAQAKAQPRLTNFFAKRLRPDTSKEGVCIDLDIEDSELAVHQEKTQVEAEADVGAEEMRAFTPTPYGTWVSEVMLQQTQVERVVEYWLRWMEKFPTIEALAKADPQDVNAVWSGLGFYGRARRLHEGAKYIIEKCGGELPNDLDALRQIPGVGPYTAGAIASIGFGRRAAVVDGNVIRVFARLNAWSGNAASSQLARQCWELAEELVDPARPGQFNQGLMELGATVCTPQAPSCERCPLRSSCKAYALKVRDKISSVTLYPEKAPRKAAPLRCFAIAIVEDNDGRVLFSKRESQRLLAGQWECPTVELESANEDAVEDEAEGRRPSKTLACKHAPVEAGSESVKPLLTLVGQLLQQSGVQQLEGITLQSTESPPIEHGISNERHRMHVFRASISDAISAERGVDSGGALCWMTPTEIANAAGITSGVQKVLAAGGFVLARGVQPSTAGKRLRAE